MIAPGDTVRAVNNETFPITIGWGNINYILQPGVDTFVPADAVINYFGDPRASLNMQSVALPNGQKAWVLDRASEVRRLRIKWQSYNMNNGELELVSPKVDIFTILGEWVPTVTNDPDGKHVNPASFTAQSELDRDQLITKMQQQLDILLREKNLGEIMEPASTESDVPVDDASPYMSEPTHALPVQPTKTKPAGDLATQLADIFQQALDSNPTMAKALATALAAQDPSNKTFIPILTEAQDKAEDAKDAA